ncbi:MAG TPA: carboxypeptidase-like regulatory domain-containing protein [Alphaproteobacteria bacterium]|nr:carboxypeptidase-like regulatory domain-containing protein [Alphaproteobacteria bacterium]
MQSKWILGALASASLIMTAGLAWRSGHAAGNDIEIVDDDIGGVVTSAKGPEAGVWVIAETADLPTKYAKMVVTDDNGRYVIPDLPKANYKVWVRGYGLVDSAHVDAAPGKRLDLAAAVAPDPKAAAEYYPASYWYALLQPPADSDFPGTGPKGNGINVQFKTQQYWFANMKENCSFCHQVGDKATRSFADNSIEAWGERVTKNPMMNAHMARFGRQRGLKMFADWSARIAGGEIPPVPPSRPEGIERNVVVTVRDWAGGRSVHDQITTDRRNPTVNAGGPSYGVSTGGGTIEIIDPKTNMVSTVNIPGYPDPSSKVTSGPHTDMMDQKGRVWIATINRSGKNPDYCKNGDTPYSKLAPRAEENGKLIEMYDPATGKVENIPICASTDHLNFGRDKDNTLFFSGEFDALGWFDTKVWDETHDPKKAEGWCPMVVDTTNAGKITGHMADWNVFGGDPGSPNYFEQYKTPDPKKQTLVTGFIYGIGVGPKDGIVWGANYLPYVPGGLVRMDRGSHPPETCKIEFYQPPLIKGRYLAFNPRGVDVDSQGVAWAAFASGQIGAFDRRKCKGKLTGPDAIGQQCPEGWSIYYPPSPKVAGTDLGSDHIYATWIDTENVMGLGKDTPFFPGTNSDSILAFLPKTKKWVVLRVPYPMGFYTRGVDARIDDPKAGWKGRTMWASYSEAMNHQEGNLSSHIATFQIRPNPLAH